MKKALLCSGFIFHVYLASAQMLITGVIDGPLPGGTPKAIEFYTLEAINNPSEFGFGVANNGGGSSGQEFTFTGGPIPQGEFLYFVNTRNGGEQGFIDFFGFDADFKSGNARLLFDGNDAIELFYQGVLIDQFGTPSHGGNPEWLHRDGWVYRNSGTTASTNFSSGDWNIQNNVLGGATENGGNGTPAFPIGSFSPGPLPINLTYFDAVVEKLSVRLNWQTEQEINNDFFQVERKTNNTNWEAIGRLQGAGTTDKVQSYSFSDTEPIFGLSYYRIKQIDFDGAFSYSSVQSITFNQTSLSAYPNPFRHELSIATQVKAGTLAKLVLHNFLGQKITEISYTTQASPYRLRLDSNLAAGIYYLKVILPNQQQTLKMLKMNP